MDILKILSRGTKKGAGKSSAATLPQKPTNPQLYHDPTRGVKRKRANEAPLAQPSTDDGADDVDFFAPKENKKQAITPEAIENTPAVQAENLVPSAQLDEEDVRQVLRSHRLKFTLLSSHEEKLAKIKKCKKKEKIKAKTKDTKQPLFPQLMTSFNELKSKYNASARLIENIAKQGYRIPTEVQLGSLPLLMQPETALAGTLGGTNNITADEGVHFLAVAPTGSGKTLSFLIPTMNSIMRRRAEIGQQNEHSLEAIIVAPTRELAHQIANEGRKLAVGTGVKIVAFKKGMRIPVEGQEVEPDDGNSSDSEDDASVPSEDEAPGGTDKASSRPVTRADILVTTPLLLLNFLTKRARSKRTLPNVRSLILDEGDVLLDPLFRDQVLGIWTSCTHELLRLTCWSATMGSNIETLVMEQLASRQVSSSPVPLIRLVVGLKDTAVPSINHRLIFTGDNERGKLFTLRQLLHPNVASDSLPDMRLPFLVFVQSIERAVSLHDELKFEFPVEAGGSTRIASLHSSLSDAARSSIITRFRAGEIWVLITTDLLMRGIDFRGVNGVINYDVPASSAAYVHRVGRTGRAGHEGGVAVTFYTKEDVPHLALIANVIALSEKQAGKSSEEGLPKWLMDALPKVRKEDKKKLKERGVESRRGSKAQISSKSAWEKKREDNRKGAIAGSKKRKLDETTTGRAGGGQDSEWSGIDD
ncbi:P-loop containing nucleoside triphosphate hydrolase protein [Pseudomassariella vexata]|uniref:ATP-dependent RNA helicase ROK1 n=1 Tax=Pseudomassariella vexata TaxID=1141098 RepID=A0A1Y2DGN2_9PEZI|nr:P-loop containing nucleoside triphosphate hydrolase protein [Pseudomassariella vexata]ORY57855.1 P-loop containing nucleoside triphosphate hydrolase protein [Pseudomassariella vexata]